MPPHHQETGGCVGEHSTTTRRPGSAWFLWPWLGVAALACVVARWPILTPDVWWHLATGRWIAEHGLPQTDPFSYTLVDHPWLVHQWLADRMLWAWHEGFGLAGLVSFRGLIVAAAFGVAYRLARQHVATGTAMILLLPAVYASQRNWLDRPQYLTFLFLPLLLLLLERHRRVAGRWIWCVPLLFLAWVNVHGGFLLGAVVLVGWTAIRTMLPGSHPGSRRTLLVVTGLSLVATLINPSGWEGATYPLQYVGSGLRGSLQEETVGSLHGPYAWTHFVLSLAVLGSFWWQRQTMVWPHLFVAVLLVLLSWPRLGSWELPFAAERHAPLLLLGGVPILAWNTRAWWQRWEQRFAQWSRQGTATWCWGLTLLAAVAVVIGLVGRWPRDNNPDARVLAGRYPRVAARWLEQNPIPGAMINPYRWGGYLIYRLHPQYSVWIDSRGDLYGPARLEEHSLLHHVPPDSDRQIQELLEKYDANVVVWPLLSLDYGPLQVSPLSRWLLASREWQLLFFDAPDRRAPERPAYSTAVFLRVHERNRALLGRYRTPRLPRLPGLDR